MYLSADLDAMVQLLARLNLRGFIEEQKESVSDRIRLQVAHILATYRRHCNPGLNKGQVIVVVVVVVLLLFTVCPLADPARYYETTPLLLKLHSEAASCATSHLSPQLPRHAGLLLLQTPGTTGTNLVPVPLLVSVYN